MFKWLFIYWNNFLEMNYINFKLNFWSFINLKLFKIKITNILIYFILSLNNLYLKEIKVFYKNLTFEFFYFNFFFFFFFNYNFSSKYEFNAKFFISIFFFKI